jgi:hypothetical protein
MIDCDDDDQDNEMINDEGQAFLLDARSLVNDELSSDAM